ncbi:beta strand repeat-containing protein [Lactiplantibacillus plantarum]|uniref:beta strand repeat-containing protein n=1 Tax=Lactiplantibacillus plantarum TaxID=1590 RepID=UPI0007B54B20|nr:hypothetical protein [Lactiplantibacillus plantarum]KZT78035.1 orf97 [Lactiplantibacillus plantarum]KZT87036.1 orf97 [Lactiplantibacillus plantarum]
MAESNATQVILTDDGIKIIKAQNTADNATSQAENADSAALIAKSTANAAKSAADSTYAYANSEININSTATAKAQSTADNAFNQAQTVGSQASAEIAVQSNATAKAQSTADNAFSQAQAVGSQASAEISSNSTATAKAQSTADNAFSQAQVVGSQASADIVVQSTATAKAQSTADNAFSQATTAIDTGKVTSQAVTDLKDGSKLTIADLENGLATKVANSEYASYKIQTASQIAQKVDNGAFSAYQTQTADLIAQKVATKDFSAYQATTAKAISSKVESSDFNTYKTQTADLIDDKVSNSAYASDKTQTASQISQMVSNSAFSAYQTQTASQIASKVDNGDFSTYKTQTANLIESKVDNGVYKTDKTQTDKDIASKVSSNDFSTYKEQTADLINDKVSNSAYASDKTQTASEIADRVSNSDFSTYQTQTASQIASKVDNGDFSTYKTQTADLISSKVATKDFSAYQATTAKSIDSKVSSNDFNTYKTQTADLIDDKVSSSEYASDKTQTASEIADRVSNSAFSTYQTQTASQIASKVDNGTFSAYQTTTAGLIAQKVATSDFSAYQATTAKEISSKVESSDFQTYQTQTKDMIASKVSKSDANNANLIPYSSNFTTPLTGWTLMNWGATDRKLLVTTHTFYQNGTGALLYLNTAQNGTAAAGSNRFPLSPNTTYTFQFKAFASSNVVGANVYLLTRTYGSTNDYDIVHGLFTNLVTSPSHIDQYTVTFTTGANDNEGYIRVDNIGSNNSASSGLFFTELKLELGGVATPYVYGGQDSMISQMSDDINLRVTKDGLIDQINIQAGNTLISSSGQLTLAGKNIYFDTVNPVIIPSANITGTLNGKTINAGTINGSTINGSTINGTTFNAGNKLNQYGNTSYPLTINQDGSVTSTSFGTIANDPAALRTVIKDGSVKTNFRGMKQLSTGIYSAADIALGAGQLALLEGYSTSQDPNFTATGMKTTGYTILDASTGLSLHGTTQAINFSGTDQNQTTGITMNSYGNIIGYPNATWWRITSNAGKDVANFGIDSAGSNPIQFKRELDIGNFQINTGHTFTSADGGAIHFAKGRGGANDIYAGDVHYNSLVKSSLLSVKKDVKKVDTAYWAQLVNSIDLATYQYKTDDNTSHLRLSSIVDDVNVTKQWKLPDVFISRDENGKLNGVDDSVLLNATLATVQEQQKEIDQLNGHNMELEARLNKLEAKLNG